MSLRVAFDPVHACTFTQLCPLVFQSPKMHVNDRSEWGIADQVSGPFQIVFTLRPQGRLPQKFGMLGEV